MTMSRRRHNPKNGQAASTDRDGLEGFDQTSTFSSSTSTTTTGTRTIFPNPETKEHRQSNLYNNPLAGMTFPRLLNLLLWEKVYSVDWFRYKARITCLFLVSLFQSLLELVESIYIFVWLRPIFRHLQSFEEEPPLFVLGHPRTGTTLLHSLLALDEERFTTCSTFCAGFPHAFLSFESIGKVLFASMISDTRPMDNMKLHFDLPQEDELATCLLTGGLSCPYMSLYFPREEREYRPYQTFRRRDDDNNNDNDNNNAAPTAKDVDTWSRAFQWLCIKLRVRNVLARLRKQKAASTSSSFLEAGNDNNLPKEGRLLLKSPCHTGRIRHLLKLYTKAHFVFIHRHPIEMFLSSAHLANTTYGFMYLQQPRDGDLKEYILRQAEILLEEYISCVEDTCSDGGEQWLVRGKNLVEVSFEELTDNPYETIKSKIYGGLEGMRHVFDEESSSSLGETTTRTTTTTTTYPQELKRHCENLKGYQRNKFESKLDDDLLNEIRTRWKVQFDRFNYSMEL
jgi:hypothetical protein